MIFYGWVQKKAPSNPAIIRSDSSSVLYVKGCEGGLLATFEILNLVTTCYMGTHDMSLEMPLDLRSGGIMNINILNEYQLLGLSASYKP